MSVRVADITALKAVDATTKKLRWVESKTAWYYVNPAASDAGDDDDIVVPNGGTGRWFKQRGVNTTSDVLYWQAQASTDFTAVVNNGYILEPTAGDVTVTLPANASLSIGDAIGILRNVDSTNFGTNRIIIDPDDSNIEGESYNREIVYKYHKVVLRYLGSGIGWVTETDKTKPILFNAGAVTTFTKPANLDDAQNGIADYAGKGYDSGGTWVNPITNNNVKVSVYKYNSTSSATFLFDKTKFGGNSVSNSFITLSDNSSNKYAEAAFFHIGFKSANNSLYQIKLKDIYWSQFQQTTYAPGNIAIYGTNNADFRNAIPYGGVISSNAAYSGRMLYGLLTLISQYDFKLVKYILKADHASSWVNVTGQTQYQHAYIPVNADFYYTDFLILCPDDNWTSATSANQPMQYVNEIEFYGDIRPLYLAS